MQENILTIIDEEISERTNKAFIAAYNMEVEKAKSLNQGEIIGLELAKQIIQSQRPDPMLLEMAKFITRTQEGQCVLCRNSQKNITLDRVNNGCDGNCQFDEHSEDENSNEIIKWFRHQMNISEPLKEENHIFLPVKCLEDLWVAHDSNNTRNEKYVYRFTVYHYVVLADHILAVNEYGHRLNLKLLGKTVFLTEDEARKALTELK